MKTLTLNNGVELPLLGFGTYQIQGEECTKSVLTAIGHGYRLIDTAEAYGNEAAVGEAIVNCGVARSELFVTTKVNFRSYENAAETVKTSLRNLRTDYLDMVLLHWPFGNYYAAWRELEKLYDEGRIRAIGVSNFDPDRLIDLTEFNDVTPAVNQVETHLLCQRKAEHCWFEKYHVAHQAYAPFGQGRANEMFDSPVLKEIAAAHGKTPRQVALRYLIQMGLSVIPKSVREERMAENIDIFDFALSADELISLAALDTATPMIGKAESPEKVEFAMTW